MKENYLVVKSNYFIMNGGFDLSSEEQKIILTLASMVSPEDEDFKPYKLKISDFMKLLGAKDQSKYSEIPKITKELMKKVFEIKEGDTLIQTAWLSSVKYEKGSGMVELSFSSHLKPYMLKLNEMYTQYRLTNILNMKSKYSIRIYEILKSNEFKKQKYTILDIDELRKLLKTEDTYTKYNDFKKYIIVKAQEELAEHSDINFEFEEIKTARKVTAIKFYITKNNPTALGDIQVHAEKLIEKADNMEIENIKNIIEESLTDYEAESLYKEANGNLEKIIDVYEYSKSVAETKTINNLVGYMVSLLKNNFIKPDTSKKGKKKKDFEEREYDYDVLERKLLGWE